MKLIPLTHGKFAMVDDADYDYLSQWKWQAYRSSGSVDTWYALRQTADRQTVLMHTLVFGSKYPDHIDRNGLNNQRSNLRPASKSQNGANSKVKKNNKSGFKGVWWYKPYGEWTAMVMCNGKRHFLGYFSDAVEAARAYDAAANKLFGDYAATNKSLGLLP